MLSELALKRLFTIQRDSLLPQWAACVCCGHRLSRGASASIITLTLLLSACGAEQTQPVSLSGQTMGTTYNISVIADHITPDSDESERLHQRITETLEQVDQQMSNWNPGSEISRFNESDTIDSVRISAELSQVISTAEAIHNASGGLFDITIAPLIEIWGFGTKTAPQTVPPQTAIDNALAHVGHTSVLQLDDSQRTLSKRSTSVTVNLAAIAKGYGIDQVAETIEQFDVDHYMVEIGGDLYVRGLNPEKQAWRIGIEKPEPGSRSVFKAVSVSDMGMATSGDYRNAFTQDGKRYSHIINPNDGMPITHNTAAATVLAESAMLADAWATAMLALGHENGMKIANDQQLAVNFIVRNDDGTFTDYSSSLFDQHFTENTR